MGQKTYAWFCQAKLLARKFFYSEEGEVNIIAIVVLCAVAIALALVFKDKLGGLLTKLFGSLEQKGVKSIES